jgi:hypothetical protein
MASRTRIIFGKKVFFTGLISSVNVLGGGGFRPKMRGVNTKI